MARHDCSYKLGHRDNHYDCPALFPHICQSRHLPPKSCARYSPNATKGYINPHLGDVLGKQLCWGLLGNPQVNTVDNFVPASRSWGLHGSRLPSWRMMPITMVPGSLRSRCLASRISFIERCIYIYTRIYNTHMSARQNLRHFGTATPGHW